MSEGGREAVRADDEVVPAGELRRLDEWVRDATPDAAAIDQLKITLPLRDPPPRKSACLSAS